MFILKSFLCFFVLTGWSVALNLYTLDSIIECSMFDGKYSTMTNDEYYRTYGEYRNQTRLHLYLSHSWEDRCRMHIVIFGMSGEGEFYRKYSQYRKNNRFGLPENIKSTMTPEYCEMFFTIYMPLTDSEYNYFYKENRNHTAPVRDADMYCQKYLFGVKKDDNNDPKYGDNRNQKGFEPEKPSAEYNRKYGDNRDQTRFSTDPMDDKEFCRKFLNVTSFTLLEEKLIRGKALALQFEELQRSIEQWNLGAMHDSSYFDIRIDEMPQTCQLLDIPSNCDEATACTKRSGFYKIKLNGFTNETLPSILVECVIDPDNGTWLIIQRRQDGSVDFYRDWRSYQAGFGDVEGEFFIGLDKLHALTNYQGPQELMIQMELENEDGNGVSAAYALYSSFAIGSRDDKYVLKRIGKYSGDAGDSLQYHVGQKFTTKDIDNDDRLRNCAQNKKGAWWYKSCQSCNLNGQYGETSYAQGINWETLTGFEVSLKYVQMMIRRRTH